MSSLLVVCALLALQNPSSTNNPAVEACSTLTEGDTCTLREAVTGPAGLEYRDRNGTCQPDECCDQDYSNGSPPEVTCGPCLACSQPAQGAETAKASDARGEPPRVGDEPPAPASNARGCAVGPRPHDTALGLVGLLGFLGLAARRRRTSAQPQ